MKNMFSDEQHRQLAREYCRSTGGSDFVGENGHACHDCLGQVIRMGDAEFVSYWTQLIGEEEDDR